MKYGCIGERLGHSFSKEIHNRLFPYEYELKEIPKDQLSAFMTARDFCAINVTIPYKEAVIPFLDEISDIARQIGAVNTIVNRNAKLYGDNTDYAGMRAMLAHAGIVLADKKVLVLGSGGTSKTALAVAQSLGCREVYRVSRTDKDGCITYETAYAQHTDAQVILNTTPCGMYPKVGESAIDLAPFDTLEGVADAVYNPLRSQLIVDAVSRKIPATGGLYMLVAQAVFAAEKFTGQTVEKTAIDRVYNELVSKKQNIVLVGMPSSGKTTVGKALSKQCSMPFVDTDEYIVDREGQAIADIFKTMGENVFRDKESAAIKEVSMQQGVVIATGGGAVLRHENVSLLKGNGRVYFLDRPLEALTATADRPLSADRDALAARYRERYPLYCAACDRRIVSPATPQQAVDEILEDIRNEITGS